MDALALALASIGILSLLAWIATRGTRFAVCPACAGVFGTWLWMVLGRFAGHAVDRVLLAVLLGATAVGVTQWFADRLKHAHHAARWKVLALPAASVVAYGVAVERWMLAAGAAAVYATLAWAFLLASGAGRRSTAAVAELEERLKRCC